MLVSALRFVATFIAAGTGAINVTGTAGNSTGAFPTHGVNVRGNSVSTGGVISVKDGNLTINGTGGNTTDNAGFSMASVGLGTLQSTGTGNIIINADRIRIAPSVSATINAATNAVTFLQKNQWSRHQPWRPNKRYHGRG
jgi:hypothetical protein